MIDYLLPPFPQVKARPQQACAYPGCVNHIEGHPTVGYCCLGCRWDHDSYKETCGEVVISDQYIKFAENWFERADRYKIDIERYYHTTFARQMWLCLFNGAFLSTDTDTGPRFKAIPNRWDGGYVIVDEHTLSMDKLTDSKYLEIATVKHKRHADKIVKALNAYEPRRP